MSKIQEELRAILNAYYRYASGVIGLRDSHLTTGEAIASLTSLIDREIIGADIEPPKFHNNVFNGTDNSELIKARQAQNRLKAQQRQRLGTLTPGGSDNE